MNMVYHKNKIKDFLILFIIDTVADLLTVNYNIDKI